MHHGVIDFRAELNPEQHEAVTGPEGHALVIAGAGSGKTRTLTYRVAWLLSQGVPPWRILLLTFTNKASREMLERAGNLLDFESRDLWGGTFHSIGNRILRRHAEEIGYGKNFTILDREDSESLLSSILSETGLRAADKNFPKASLLSDIFGFAANTCADLETVFAKKYPFCFRYQTDLHKVRDLYEARKREMNALDFDDLLSKCAALFEMCPHVLAKYQSQFRHILVDEFQDTNPLQAAFIEKLGAGGASIMAVGDDAQAIYSWRGADCANILEFPKRHPDARIFQIETNYRSVPEVLELANAVIAANVSQFPKNLVSSRPPGGMCPMEVSLPTNNEQAYFIANSIADLLEGGADPGEIAVLYRSHFHSMEVQMELTRRRIPFRLTSGPRFFEQAHIKDVAAFMKAAINPADRVAFERMAMLAPGIGPKAAENLWKQSTGALGTPADFRALHAATKPPRKSTSAWTQMIHILEELAPGGSPMKPESMIRSVREAFYDDYLRVKYPNAENRVEDLGTFQSYAAEFESAELFLAELALLGDTETGVRERDDRSEPRVTLSSVHQAKGLEWDTVFVIWLSDGMFPGRRSLDDTAALEEERRLFYVAVTRCKDNLVLTRPEFWSNASTGDPFQPRSRFLAEIPPHLLASPGTQRPAKSALDSKSVVDEPF